ncbi:Axonemal dynein light intermediate polypeptide 1 [Willisornis vidua]|uniref:Axonemal dynein light intermediate polypeptide 1 n=1 Tax=Willisornis vidua TaxID=1566151 RepID=A0ABQ9DF98_9PASS|nr:Axonemal dynein light intermediate polypeptide 1 [Willisornis vidua]
MAAPPESLLRYSAPALISRRGEKGSAGARSAKGTPRQPPPRTPPAISPTPQHPQELLNAILPPREWEEAQKLWVQEVSTAHSTRRDVVLLQEQLDRQLQQQQARETGLCPVRRELYSQCFDELIRQTTVSCAERGLLLLRVRDELQLTLAAYQTLYQSSVDFGVRKALEAEQGKALMEKRIAELEEERSELERQVGEEKAKCEAIEKQENERREIEEKKHSEEVLFLKRANQQLKTQLESIIAAKS